MAILSGIALAAASPLGKKVLRWVGIGAGVLALIGVSIWGFNSWRNNLIERGEKAGYAQAEREYTAAVDAANAKVAITQDHLDKLYVSFGMLAASKSQAINLKLEPTIERINRELAEDPVYRECAVSGGMLIDLNTGRSAINESIRPADPR